MTAVFDEMTAWELGLEDCDIWAIKVVVREGRYMPLNRTEATIACQLMRRKNVGFAAICLALRMSKGAAVKMCRHDKTGVDIDELIARYPEIIGPVLPDVDPLPISAIELRRAGQRRRARKA